MSQKSSVRSRIDAGAGKSGQSRRGMSEFEVLRIELLESPERSQRAHGTKPIKFHRQSPVIGEKRPSAISTFHRRVAFVCVTQAFIGYEFDILATNRLAVARGKIPEVTFCGPHRLSHP